MLKESLEQLAESLSALSKGDLDFEVVPNFDEQQVGASLLGPLNFYGYLGLIYFKVSLFLIFYLVLFLSI